MRMTSFVVPPGADREGCEYAVAPNRLPMDVAGFELNVTPGAHHFVLSFFCGMGDAGLLILPTHRVVHSLKIFNPKVLLEFHVRRFQ